MTSWTPVESQSKDIGPYRVVYLRPDHGSEGAHEVQFPDGRAIRVLPGTHSGQKRSRTISEALKALSAAGDESHGYPLTAYVDEHGKALFDPVAYLVGVLATEGIPWEEVNALRTVSIEEWLEEWFGGGPGPRERAEQLLDDLALDGWVVVRREEP